MQQKVAVQTNQPNAASYIHKVPTDPQQCQTWAMEQSKEKENINKTVKGSQKINQFTAQKDKMEIKNFWFLYFTL